MADEHMLRIKSADFGCRNSQVVVYLVLELKQAAMNTAGWVMIVGGELPR